METTRRTIEEFNYKQNLKHDGQVAIATANSRTSKHWKNKSMMYSALVDKLSQTTRTPETYAEYKKMSKTDRDRIKDVGGFVGGNLKEGRRKAENVQNRTLLTLDLDYVSGDVWESIELLFDFSVCMYSTHTHAPDNQRLRLVIPLSRPVLPDEYQAIARRIADDIGIDQFDDTTYEPCRLMYWPSTSSDGEYVFKVQDLEWLNPDEVLDRYTFGWQDVSYWPESSRAKAKLNKAIQKQEDPLIKKGIIGAFCRTYSISEVIAEFLSDVYIPGADETRYTYAEGSTSGGVVVYDDKFSYSHHGTDPASCILCNAFDLVRIHKFGELDDEAKEGTPQASMPSFLKMKSFAAADKNVLVTIGQEKMMLAQEEFDVVNEDEEYDTEWLKKLEYTKNSALRKTVKNFRLIIENEPLLKGKLRYDIFSMHLKVVGQLPWRVNGNMENWSDKDDTGLLEFIETYYDLKSKPDMDAALQNTFELFGYHPIKEYIESIPWDGEKRAETMLIDYLGAEDNEYSKLVSLKILTGAIKRIYEPGCKFELIPVLSGSQGKGKSTIVEKLGKEWFTSFDNGILFLRSKELSESTQGMWIIEWAEYGANKKKDSKIKSLLSKNDDNYRPAYGRRTLKVPRQFVMIATTNETEILTDNTGDRRFLPLIVGVNEPKKDIFDNNDFKIHFSDEVQQIWAEAYYLYKNGYRAYLNSSEYKMIEEYKDQFRETDPMYDDFVNYMEKPICENWYDLKLDERVAYLWGDVTGKSIPGSEQIPRYRVCLQAIYDEFIVQRYTTTFSNLKDAKGIIQSYLQKLKWSKKAGGDNGRLKFGVYERQVAYLKH